MRHSLKLHPACTCDPVETIEVEVHRSSVSGLSLRYSVSGDVTRLELPPAGKTVRQDGLWQHTCFEVFLRQAGRNGYLEFNFAPSRAWASYRFDSYRESMAPAEDVAAPHIGVTAKETGFTLDVRLDGLPILGSGTWHLGLSAVIEEVSGNKSYWALAHPPGKPDFHHSDCFAVDLPIAEVS